MSARTSVRASIALLIASTSPLFAQTASVRPFPMRVVGESEKRVHFVPNAESVRALAAERQIQMTLPMPGSADAEVTLKRLDLFNERSIIAVDGIEHAALDMVGDVTLWGGEVLGEEGSFVFLSLSPRGSRGVIRQRTGLTRLVTIPGADGSWATGESILEKVDASEGASIQAACQSSFLDQPLLQSSFPSDPDAPPLGKTGFATTRECEIAVETDFQFYSLFDDEDDAAAYVADLFGAVSAFYLDQVGCIITLPYVGIHTKAGDGWSSPDSGDAEDVLYEFRAAWKNGNAPVSANLYHFLSGANLGGGIAYINALCSDTYGFGVSGNIEGNLTFPVSKGFGTWDFVVVSHELGHNFSSPHTHDFCPPLDSCAPPGYFGSCQSDQTCVTDGTIMSYCHICSGGMSNIDIEFHSSVITQIRTAIDASCLEEAVPVGEIVIVSDDTVTREITWGDDPDDATITIDDAGQLSNSLSWSASIVDQVEWVSFASAQSGTITSSPADIDLAFNPLAAGTGTHSTILRVTNLDDITDTVDIPVTFIVDPTRFVSGDSVVGSLFDGDDVDIVEFDGLTGMTLYFDFETTIDDPALKITVLDPNGKTVDIIKVNSDTTTQKKVTFSSDGTFALKVKSKDGSFGDFEFETSRDLPGSASDKIKTLSPKSKKNYADLKFRALADATLDVAVTPNSKVEGPLSILLFDPFDNEIDVSAFVSGDGLSLTDVPLDETGKYRLRISGFVEKKKSKEKADVEITLTQPTGTDEVSID